jgi:hypothetical protein
LLLAGAAFHAQTQSVQPPEISASAMEQIQALHQEKLSRTPVQQKLESQFVLRLKQERRQIYQPSLANLPSRLKFEPDGRLLVDIDAKVTGPLLERIKQSGGTVLSCFPGSHAIRALVTLGELENLAASEDVKYIRRASRAHRHVVRVDSQGDTTLGALALRNASGLTGVGVKVGVLSDSVDFLTNSQASGQLDAVTVLTGQGGTGAGEGTAMLEIVHDLAPGAQLYFATAFNSEASFAQNILNLRSNGCDIIVDDVSYFDESPFQDGIVAQAVNAVTADGALYFSSAGNDGNLDAHSSATWEGDFLDGGAAGSILQGFGETGARLHNFGPATFDRIVSPSSGTFDVGLFWADPLGASTNDYDLFVLNSAGTAVFDFSNNSQTGTQDPIELCTAQANDRVVIVKFSGAGRFLHMQVFGDGAARLNNGTSGNTLGHACAANALCVAAVNAQAAFPNLFNSSNTVESFSSDGPRRVFFNADGTPITAGNFSSTGGAVRLKPDLASADGVSTTVPGPFQPLFFGTSAAAPHAAAIAALLKSARPDLPAAEIRTILTNAALDIMAPGWDRDSGAGIALAEPAAQELLTSAPPMVLSIIQTRGTIVLNWATAAGHAYQLQFTTSLAPPVWNNLGAVITASNSMTSVSDAVDFSANRYYRVVRLQ